MVFGFIQTAVLCGIITYNNFLFEEECFLSINHAVCPLRVGIKKINRSAISIYQALKSTRDIHRDLFFIVLSKT